jgi:hypothetical protein
MYIKVVLHEIFAVSKLSSRAEGSRRSIEEEIPLENLQKRGRLQSTEGRLLEIQTD